MPFIVYVGPFHAVDVPRWQIAAAEPGVPVEVSQEAADDLLGQVANWAPVPAGGFATGGVVTLADQMPALVGEVGPETVIPLDTPSEG